MSKNQQRREVIKAVVMQSKQPTLDNLPFASDAPKSTEGSRPPKSIVIIDISSVAKEDELALSVAFSLLPSKKSFSKLNLDLFFQNQALNCTSMRIHQSPLLNNSFNFPLSLNMKGMVAGDYVIRVEMYEPWPPQEKLYFTTKKTTLHYIPQTRQARLVKIPTVKSVPGSNLTVVSSSVKGIYRELEQDQKKESISKRDEW